MRIVAAGGVGDVGSGGAGAWGVGWALLVGRVARAARSVFRPAEQSAALGLVAVGAAVGGGAVGASVGASAGASGEAVWRPRDACTRVAARCPRPARADVGPPRVDQFLLAFGLVTVAFPFGRGICLAIAGKLLGADAAATSAKALDEKLAKRSVFPMPWDSCPTL